MFMLMRCLFLSGFVLSQFSEKLTDVVKYVGEPVTMRFKTDYTAPDFLRRLPNGTDVMLVASGRVNVLAIVHRYNVTSVRRESPYTGYVVTLIISEVEKQDAGTYLARSEDDVEHSVKNQVELVVTGRSDFTLLRIKGLA